MGVLKAGKFIFQKKQKKGKKTIEHFKNLLYTRLWLDSNKPNISFVTGHKCKMVRCLLEPRVYLRPSSSDFLTKVCRKGENSPHLKENQTKLNRRKILDKYSNEIW